MMTTRNARRLSITVALIAMQLLAVSCTNKTATSQTDVPPVTSAAR